MRRTHLMSTPLNHALHIVGEASSLKTAVLDQSGWVTRANSIRDYSEQKVDTAADAGAGATSRVECH